MKVKNKNEFRKSGDRNIAVCHPERNAVKPKDILN